MYLVSTAPGHLAPLDAPLLARLCLALAYADQATAQVQAVGLLVKAPNTKLPIQSPWLAIMNRQTEIARKLAAELALPRRSAAGPAWRRRATPSVRTTGGASDMASASGPQVPDGCSPGAPIEASPGALAGLPARVGRPPLADAAGAALRPCHERLPFKAGVRR